MPVVAVDTTGRGTSKRSSRAPYATLMLFFVGGCGSTTPSPSNKAISSGDDPTTACKSAKDPLNPLIVEWPATSKAELDRASKRGIVIVRYAGCTLKVLEACSAKGSYAYTGVTPGRAKMDIATENDLFARLPLGAISLKPELASSGGLRLDYIAVGQRLASSTPTKLEGTCEGATHYVRTISLGAFALGRMARAHADAGVEESHASNGLEQAASGTLTSSSGDPDKCTGTPPTSEDAATSVGCGTPLQLDLAPLQVAGDVVVAGGFGQGLGGIGAGPTDLRGTDVNASPNGVDTAYVALLQNATRVDRDKTTKPTEKATAWGALADYKGDNPSKKLAEDRRDAWEKRAADLEKLKEQYLADKTRLEKLLALDDDTVPKESKAAYRKEFAEVYEPWEADLGVAVGLPGTTSKEPSAADETSSKLGTIRIDVEGGLDVQQLKYSLKDSKRNAVYLPNSGTTPGTASFMEGDAGGAGGFIGAIITLPQIPAPGFGLSAIVRYALGADVNRLVAGAGMRFAVAKPTTSSGIAIGVWASYVKLFDGKTDSLSCPSTEGGKGCTAQYKQLVAVSNGGADFRLALMYDLALGDIFALTVGGTVNYALFPYSLKGTSMPTGGMPTSGSGLMQGVGATLNAGLGAHF